MSYRSLDVELQLQRLEYRYRRAQNALAGARTIQAALRENTRTSALKLQQAARQVEEAQRYLIDLQSAIDRAEDQVSTA
jgi:chromosome segregation ATPase